MAKRFYILAALLFLTLILASCAYRPKDFIAVEYRIWGTGSFTSEFIELQAQLDDTPIYLHFLKNGEISFAAAMDREFLPSGRIQLTADDPTIMEVTSTSGSTLKKLKVLKPEAGKAILTLTLSDRDGKTVNKKLILVFAECLVLEEGFRIVDFDGREVITRVQWNGMDSIQRSVYDMVIEYLHTDDYPYDGSFTFPYGYISIPDDFFSFATYDFYPESGNLPSVDQLIWQSDPARYSDLFLVESSEGRIYKVLFYATHLDFIEIQPNVIELQGKN